MPDSNVLYYGDNLDVLRLHFKDESVDLVYLDPPFNSNADYNVLFAEQDGSRAAAQIKAFNDTWRWDQASASAFEEVVEAGGKPADAMLAFRTLLNQSDMLAYLSMMAPRLIELRRVLKVTGSIYLHCDPTASHYLKMLMDAVFGPSNFQNEIIWRYRRWTGEARRFLKMHDVILFYAKSAEHHHFNRLFTPYTEKSLRRKQNYHTRIKGDDVYVTSVNPKGVAENDVWEIQLLNSQAKERLGYPTQKPEALLERIVAASSNEDDTVLDPFCGCGTTVAVAHRMNRRWLGIDITHLAVGLIKHRLLDAYGESASYKVLGEPVSVEDAETLAASDPYQFQFWALGLVGARPAEERKGPDRGIDGRLYFHDEGVGGRTKQIVLSVKAGSVTASQVRDLRGVLEREKADIGVLISFEEPTKAMRTEAAGAGFYKSPWGIHPRLQLLTVGELLKGKKIDYPPARQTNVTFKKAPRVPAEDHEQLQMVAEPPPAEYNAENDG